MSVLSLSYWESDVYWRQNNKRFAELALQIGGKQLIWRNTSLSPYVYSGSKWRTGGVSDDVMLGTVIVGGLQRHSVLYKRRGRGLLSTIGLLLLLLLLSEIGLLLEPYLFHFADYSSWSSRHLTGLFNASALQRNTMCAAYNRIANCNMLSLFPATGL